MFNIGPEDIRNACSTNKTYYGICSDYLFWIDKFRKENISFLIPKDPQSLTLRQWLDIYERLDPEILDIMRNLRPKQLIVDISYDKILEKNPLYLYQKDHDHYKFRGKSINVKNFILPRKHSKKLIEVFTSGYKHFGDTLIGSIYDRYLYLYYPEDQRFRSSSSGTHDMRLKIYISPRGQILYSMSITDGRMMPPFTEAITNKELYNMLVNLKNLELL